MLLGLLNWTCLCCPLRPLGSKISCVSGWERLNHSCKIIITAGLRFTLAKGVLTTFFLMCLVSIQNNELEKILFPHMKAKPISFEMHFQVPSCNQNLLDVGSWPSLGHCCIIWTLEKKGQACFLLQCFKIMTIVVWNCFMFCGFWLGGMSSVMAQKL